MIGGNELLTEIEGIFPKLGVYLRTKIVPAIETTAQNAAVSPVGKVNPPDQPEAVHVTTHGEYMQITVDHNAPIQKGIQYIHEISTNPQFSQPYVHDSGSSRSPVPFPMPSKDADGNPINYYVRSMAQYPGSDPSPHTYHGGDTPVAIKLSGTTQGTLPAATGSGTGAGNGQQAGVGLGKVQIRPAVAPKRNVG